MISWPCTLEESGLLEKGQLYRDALVALSWSGIPFLVGGAFALKHYTGIIRDTKDFDIFVRPEDLDAILDLFESVGYRTERTFPHWLGKAISQDHVIDIIFNSGNGLSKVDDTWFRYAPEGELLGVKVLFCPAEETIHSKAFIMERERYDGADVIHILRACGVELNWERLLERFGPHWQVLLSYIILFGFVYPAERDDIPGWVTRELLSRFERSLSVVPPDDKVCRGTIISHTQYRVDVDCWNYKDGRLVPEGNLTRENIDHMTHMFKDKK